MEFGGGRILLLEGGMLGGVWVGLGMNFGGLTRGGGVEFEGGHINWGGHGRGSGGLGLSLGGVTSLLGGGGLRLIAGAWRYLGGGLRCHVQPSITDSAPVGRGLAPAPPSIGSSHFEWLLVPASCRAPFRHWFHWSGLVLHH